MHTFCELIVVCTTFIYQNPNFKMPKWCFAPAKYVIWPGHQCNCIYKLTWTIECAFSVFLYVCTACLCLISLWLSFSGQLARSHPLSQWIMRSFFFAKPVGMSATPYGFLTWCSGLKNRWISCLDPLEMPQIQNLGITIICLKCVWQRDL